MKTPFIVLLLAAVLITAGCSSGIAGRISGPAPVVINSEGEDGWVRYTNSDLHFSISRPANWDIISVPKDTIAKRTTMDLTYARDRFVFICTPNTTVCVMIFGMDYPADQGSLYEDPQRTKIADGVYYEFLESVRSASFAGGKVAITGSEENSSYFQVNGNPARFASFVVETGGNSQVSDGYMIAHENSYYSEWYAARPGSKTSDIAAAAEILRTFTVTE